MNRVVPPHPKKGSAEAYAWAKKMQAARVKAKRTKKAAPLKKNPTGFFWVRLSQRGAVVNILGPYESMEDAEKTAKKARRAGYRADAYSNNPDQQWHKYVARTSDRYRKEAAAKAERILYAGMVAAHNKSVNAASKMRMNPRKKTGGAYTPNLIRQCAWCKKPMGSLPPYDDTRVTHGICAPCLKKELEKARKTKKNPIAVYNPPPEVAGTIYNKAIEIRAKKTGGDLAGRYKHIFGDGVRILGLTDGTVLLQHKNGKPLWISRKDHERGSGKS